ncbi:MAG: TetR/AcrR family transcriptional regulator [Bacteroidales bacterium]|nr:TetR/AcrR family transcriptional regulator [Bacteroidales bacterium]
MQTSEQQILNAAEEEFLSKGYDGARTTSIAKSAGVTHAMLHYYFRTKEQLFETFISKKIQEIKPLMLYIFGDASLPLLERLEQAISRHFDFVCENEDLVRFLINEILPSKERCQILKNQLQELFDVSQELQEEIDQAAKRNEIEYINVIMLFQTILTINIFPSLMSNYISNIMNLTTEEDIAKFKNERKKENIKIIMKRLQKL